MEIDIANLVSALGTLAAAYFAYNQYTKNKMTDLKKWSTSRKKRKGKVTAGVRTRPGCSVSFGGFFMKRKRTGCISSNLILWDMWRSLVYSSR